MQERRKWGTELVTGNRFGGKINVSASGEAENGK